MKTQFKVLSVLAAALAVVFSTAGVSMAFSAPGEMANCRTIDGGLSFECDPVSNLAVVNNESVIPVTGFISTDLEAFLLSQSIIGTATSLRSINDFTPSTTELILADFVANPSATEFILADFVANPSVVATSLRMINEISLSADDLSMSDSANSLPDVDLKLDLPPLDDFYFGGHYGGMPY